jgi:hypothetical protein
VDRNFLLEYANFVGSCGGCLVGRRCDRGGVVVRGCGAGETVVVVWVYVDAFFG